MSYLTSSPTGLLGVTVTVMLGTTSVILATTIINVVLPGIMLEFAVEQERVQWLSTGFLAAMALTMLTTAWWVRVYGLRRTYQVALCLFIVLSIIGGCSTSIDLLITTRIVQGAIAGVIQPLAMIALFAVYPVHKRGKAMAAYGLGAILSPAIGPALGGILGEWFGWRAVFFVTLPMCVMALWLAPTYLVNFTREVGQPKRFDYYGFMLLAVFLFLTLGGLAYLQHNSFTWIAHNSLSGLILLAAISVVVLVGGCFIRWESSQQVPLVDLSIFTYRSFALASLIGFAYGMGLYGSTFLIPLFVQTISGYSVLQAGLLLLPGGLLLALMIPVAGYWADRSSPHWIVCAGLACFAISFFLMATASQASTFWLLASWIALGRVGLALVIPALNSGAFYGLPDNRIAQGAGALNFVRQIGGAFGTCLLSLLLQWRITVHSSTSEISLFQATTQAFDDSFLALGIIFLLALLPAWWLRQYN